MMQKLFMTGAVLFVAAGIVGCQGQEREELAEVPPPMYDDAETFEPVAVTDDEPTEPVVVDEGAAGGANQSSDSASANTSDAGGSTSYTIRRGDTLWSIAHRHYGDGQKWQQIVEANPGLRAERLPVGEEIVLP